MTFNNPVVGGAGGELIRESIKSPDFIAGVQGWIIRRDGSAEFNNVTIRFELGTGSIIIGPASGPQVHIYTTATGGRIEFPTHSPHEDGVAVLRSSIVSQGDPDESLILSMRSPSVDGIAEYAVLTMRSARADGSVLQQASLGLQGVPEHSEIELLDTALNLYTPVVNTDNEIYVGTDHADANFPTRVVAGLIGTGTTNTTIGTGSATAITNASGSVHLVQGAAYRMEVTVPLSATATSSAAGTQRVTWTIWRGTVGSGTRLGALSRKFKVGAVGSMQEDVSFYVLFRHTVATGSYTLALGAQHTQGTDTLQATYNDSFNMVLTRIGDPALITNL